MQRGRHRLIASFASQNVLKILEAARDVVESLSAVGAWARARAPTCAHTHTLRGGLGGRALAEARRGQCQWCAAHSHAIIPFVACREHPAVPEYGAVEVRGVPGYCAGTRARLPPSLPLFLPPSLPYVSSACLPCPWRAPNTRALTWPEGVWNTDHASQEVDRDLRLAIARKIRAEAGATASGVQR